MIGAGHELIRMQIIGPDSRVDPQLFQIIRIQ
ncbi:uncharacterized protein METZ01_LOCUS431249 [marine metagenome]|uniref:Uncharacterized protein n=1 Tax=marine metagenome TaxID=408172 RepID=A0A382Y6A7_9ZZZZ